MPYIIPAYIEMLESVIKQGCHGYACIFDQVPSRWREEGGVSVHSIELPYVFGDWDDSTGWWKSIAMFVQQLGVKTANPELSTVDRNVSEAMMGLWASFAKTGKPRAQGVPDWPEYSADKDQYLYICDGYEVRTGYSKVVEQTLP
jgi:para-nitrobenzyl esterase